MRLGSARPVDGGSRL